MRTRPLGVRSRVTGASFGEGATLLRRAEGSRDENGEWVPGQETETQIRLSIQPPPGKDKFANFERVIETGGLRLAGLVVVYSAVELRPAGDGTIGDLIRTGGVSYRVVAVESWGAYWTALAERLEPQEGT